MFHRILGLTVFMWINLVQISHTQKSDEICSISKWIDGLDLDVIDTLSIESKITFEEMQENLAAGIDEIRCLDLVGIHQNIFDESRNFDYQNARVKTSDHTSIEDSDKKIADNSITLNSEKKDSVPEKPLNFLSGNLDDFDSPEKSINSTKSKSLYNINTDKYEHGSFCISLFSFKDGYCYNASIYGQNSEKRQTIKLNKIFYTQTNSSSSSFKREHTFVANSSNTQNVDKFQCSLQIRERHHNHSVVYSNIKINSNKSSIPSNRKKYIMQFKFDSPLQISKDIVFLPISKWPLDSVKICSIRNTTKEIYKRITQDIEKKEVHTEYNSALNSFLFTYHNNFPKSFLSELFLRKVISRANLKCKAFKSSKQSKPCTFRKPNKFFQYQTVIYQKRNIFYDQTDRFYRKGSFDFYKRLYLLSPRFNLEHQTNHQRIDLWQLILSTRFSTSKQSCVSLNLKKQKMLVAPYKIKKSRSLRLSVRICPNSFIFYRIRKDKTPKSKNQLAKTTAKKKNPHSSNTITEKSSEIKTPSKISKDANHKISILQEELHQKNHKPSDIVKNKDNRTANSKEANRADNVLHTNVSNCRTELAKEADFANLTSKIKCDNDWIIVLDRFDGSVDFNRTWNEYRNGFGDIDGEYYIGNEKLHQITTLSNRKFIVEIVIKSWSTINNADCITRYDGIQVDSEDNQYELKIGPHSPSKSYVDKNSTVDCGDSLSVHHLSQFSTFDRDNDRVNREFSGNCAKRFGGGWWYFSCYRCNPTGIYYPDGIIQPAGLFDGISWKTFSPANDSLMSIQIKIK